MSRSYESVEEAQAAAIKYFNENLANLPEIE